MGVVVEQDRPDTALDRMRWYCKKCSEIVHESAFHLTDLGTQIKQGILEFEADIDKKTCKKCGTVNSSKPE